jgi:hypothetical protein
MINRAHFHLLIVIYIICTLERRAVVALTGEG